MVSRAQGEADRFSKLVAEYRKAPEITRQRLYIDTMQEVYSNTSKVLVSGKDGQSNLLYLPLDKMIDGRRGAAGATSGVPAASSETTTRIINDLERRDLRSRESR
ncbi:Modulator of FtsH protease HflK [compost metagenome]